MNVECIVNCINCGRPIIQNVSFTASKGQIKQRACDGDKFCVHSYLFTVNSGDGQMDHHVSFKWP